MRTRRPSSRAIGALLVLCLLMASAVALEMRYPEVLVRELQSPADGNPVVLDIEIGGATTSGRYQPPGEDDFSVIEERPLFSPDRRPPDTEPSEATDGEVTPSALDGLVLTGIIGAGERRIAIIEPEGPPRAGAGSQSLQVGEELRGWTVTEIETDRILLVAGTQRFYMTLIDELKRRRPRNPLQPRASQPVPNRSAPQSQQAPQQLQIQPQPQSQTPQPNR